MAERFDGRDDDEMLLTRLGAAFAVPAVEPPAEGYAALQRSLAERDVSAGARPRSRRRSSWRRPLPVAGLVFGMALGGSGAALAAGAPLPRPVRALAHDIGLPVDSPGLVDVRKANTKLRDDLRPPTTSPDTGRDAADLARKLSGLDTGERAEVETESHDLLERARGGGPGSPSSPTTSSGSEGGPTAGSGGRSGGDGSGSAGSSGTPGPSVSGSDSRGSGSGSGSGTSGADDGRSTATTTPSGGHTPSTTTDDSHGGSPGGGGSGGRGDGGGSGSGPSGSSGTGSSGSGSSPGGGGGGGRG